MRRFAAALALITLAGCGKEPAPTIEDRAFPGPEVDPPRAVVWAVGDGATPGPRGPRVARRIAADRPHRVLYLGDVYEDGTAAEFRRNFTGVYRSLVPRMLPTPGNHEWGNRRTGYDAYWRRVTGHATPPWYRVELAGWELLSLNTEAAHDAASPQLRWLRRAVTAPGTCRLAFWHHPRWSASRHGDTGSAAALWNALRGRAVLVLSGHDHVLQRFRPRNGIVQVVAGAGGRARYSLRRDRRLAFADDDHDGAVRIELERGVARMSFVSAGGRVLDRSTIRCRPA
jgi:Calcineurin-like phosphoesterase